jgi:hypothetical protein
MEATMTTTEAEQMERTMREEQYRLAEAGEMEAAARYQRMADYYRRLAWAGRE